MVKAGIKNKSKQSKKPDWSHPINRAIKNFQQVKDKDLGEGLINLTIGLISKRYTRQK
jgi:hypothetical protein